MKIRGRNIGRRLQLLGNNIARAKHYHGYGVHSPFVYSLIRKVFMSKTLFEDSGTALYDSLRANGVAERRARQLHNLLPFTEGQSYSINDIEGDISILLSDYPIEQFREAYEIAKEQSLTLVVMQPYLNRERQNAVKTLMAEHLSTVVDNRAYIIFFNNHLPKQYYRL